MSPLPADLAPSAVDHAKLLPPRQALLLSRSRLLEPLLDRGSQRVAIVSAGPGYGKSALLMDFSRSCPGPVAWYRLDRADRDVTRFTQHLVETVRQSVPGFAAGLEASLPRLLALGVERGVMGGILSDEFTRLGGELVLVFDDYHTISDSEPVNALLGYLLECAAPGLRFVIACRGSSRLPVARLRAYGVLRELTTQDLEFSSEEAERLLALHGCHLNQAQVDLIYQKTLGWGAGLVMVAHSLRRPGLGADLSRLEHLGGSAELIYNYLAEEVLARQPQPVQEFLLRTCILSNVRPEICDPLLGVQNSAEVLADLERGGLFTFLLSPSGPVFKYHPLFGDFLREKLHTAEAPEVIQGLHARSAGLLAGSHEWAEAILHYCAAGLPGRAADIVEMVGPPHVEAGLLETVRHWIGILPVEIVRSRPGLSALHGRILQHERDYDGALLALERAFRLFEAGGDTAGQAIVGCELGLLHTRRGTSEQGIVMLERVLSQGIQQPLLRADVLRALSADLRESGQLIACVERGEQALVLATGEIASVPQARTLLRVARTLAHGYINQGKLRKAVDTLETARQATAWTSDADIETGWLWCWLAVSQYCSGDFDAALASFEEAEALTARHVATQREIVQLWRGCLNRDIGEFGQAEKEMAEAGDAALADLAFLRLRQDHRDEALYLARRAYRLRQLPAAVMPRLRVEGTLGIVLARNGLREAAARHLDAVERSLAERGAEHRLASLLLHRASIYLDYGSSAAADEALRTAFGLAVRNGYSHFLWWDPAVVGKMCGHALARAIEPQYASDLAASRLGRDQSAFFLELLASDAPDVREAALSVLQEIAAPAEARQADIVQLLRGCGDDSAREHIAEALRVGELTREGLLRLRERYGLTWKETEIFVFYYLRPTLVGRQPGANLREECARQLWLSQNTVRSHVKHIRQKLTLPAETGTVSMRDWLLQAGMLSAG